jgi:MFS family permease
VYTIGFLIVGMPRFAVAALTSSPAPLIAMMAVEGLACGPLSPITIGITYQLTPEDLRGRAIGTMTGTALIATPFGALAAGQLVDTLGLPAATAIFGGVYLLVTLVPAGFPLYRRMSDTVREPIRLAVRRQHGVRVGALPGLRVGVHDDRGQPWQCVQQVVFGVDGDLVRLERGNVAAHDDLALGAQLVTDPAEPDQPGAEHAGGGPQRVLGLVH